MQPLVLHPPSLTTAQFGQPRFNSGPERLPLNRSWSTNARGCSPRAAFPRQSMSGSPPPEEKSPVTSKGSIPAYPPISEPAGTATETTTIPTITTTAEDVSSSLSTTTTATAQSLPAASEPLSTAQIPPRYGDQSAPPYATSPRPLAGTAYPLPPFETSVPGPTTPSLTQKSTRRTKAHVASACVNCKKKHLGCDPARPCRRCVLAGKASSCVDVTHKKRGRPPLKAEDSSLRSYTTHMDNPGISTEVQPSVAAQRGVMHRATSSRELRPMTDLQGIPDSSSTAPLQIPRGQPHRWSASVFPLTRPMDPSPTMPNTVGRRPFSASGPPTYATQPYPPPAFVPITGGFNPVLKTAAMPPGMERRFPPYAAPALPPPTSPQQHHLPAGVPYLPYAEPPSSSIHPHPPHQPHQPYQPTLDPRLPPGSRELYLESPVRLPPIHQATASPGPPHHAHRLSDPYPATWTSSREVDPREPRSPSLYQRPSSSIFTHSASHQRSSSQTGPLDPVPRHLGPIELPSPVALGQSPSIERRAPDVPSTEPQSQEQRPIKRRKMALDDMVNG